MKSVISFLFICLLVFQIGVTAVASDTTDRIDLYPFDYKGQWGYMDNRGNVIVEPTYDDAAQFFEGLARVGKKRTDIDGHISEKCGFIDKHGEIVIPLIYDSATSFINGNAVVELLEREDEGGELVNITYWIKPNGKYFHKEKIPSYTTLCTTHEPFCEGLSAINSGDVTGHGGFINYQGEIVIPIEYYSISSFSEGLASVDVYPDNPVDLDTTPPLTGYINHKNEMVIPPKFELAYPFSGGLASVSIRNRQDAPRKFGYIDTTGKFVIPMMYDWAYPFSEGIAAIKINGKWGFINTDNKMIIEPQYDNVGDKTNGLIMIQDSKGNYLYYIDENNNIIKPKI